MIVFRSLLALSALGVVALAADAPAPKIISQPALTGPLGSEWSVAKGKWEPKEGVLYGTDLPEEHHAAVLHLATGPTALAFECEFRFATARSFLIGCDGNRHVGRIIATPKGVKLAEDSTEVKGKSPSHVLAEAKADFSPSEWHHLRLEYREDRLSLKLDSTDLTAQHPYLATPKTRWWFAVGGGTAEIRNVKVSVLETKP